MKAILTDLLFLMFYLGIAENVKNIKKENVDGYYIDKQYVP